MKYLFSKFAFVMVLVLVVTLVPAKTVYAIGEPVIVFEQPDCRTLAYRGFKYDAETMLALDYYNSFTDALGKLECMTSFKTPPLGMIVELNGQRLLETTPGRTFESDKTLAQFGLKDNQKIIFTYSYIMPDGEKVGGAVVLYNLWLLVKDDGTACLIKGKSHPSVSVQNAVCFPEKYNRTWSADKTLCSAPFYSNGVWACYEDLAEWWANR